MDDFETQIKFDSLDEFDQYITELNDIFNRHKDAKVDTSTINEIFRLVHTIKGNSKAVGFASIADVTHKLEELLIEVRNSKRPYSAQVQGALIEYCDRLADSVEVLRENIDADCDFAQVQKVIQTVLATK